MLDIAEHRQKLILKNLAQLDDRINEIQEECIILYLKSFIGDGAELLSPYQFSNITHIKHDTIINVLKGKVKFKPYQQRRWCYCILYHWDTIIDTLNKKHVAESKNFEKDNIEIILKTGEIKKYLIIKENQKNISEDEILKFLEEDNE